MKRLLSVFSTALISFVLLAGFVSPVAFAAGKPTRILVTTFPIFQITRNIIGGQPSVVAVPMLSSATGCPHDYVLTPRDMEKIAKADILVINGLGLEEFMGAPLKKANPALKIIDSSQGIGNLLPYEEMETDAHGHHHHHSGPNPHLFASPKMVALITMNIATALSAMDPSGASVYMANAQNYAAKMNGLADKFVALGPTLKNNRIVTQHGVFDYLARDMGLSVVAVIAEHAGTEPSAADMLHIVSTIKTKKPGVLFTEPQYPQKTAQALSRETGIPVATLDPVATGPENAPLNYYETIMDKNLMTLTKYLGAGSR